ncbi:MAG: Invasion protein InvA [Chlamydiae bacterium]|nr:Invasion protein InvA [Chlamydiota bacterium]
MLRSFKHLLAGHGAFKKISQSADIVLAFFIIGIITMIILPVPPPLIDVLLAVNLTVAISLIMLSLYIPNAIELSMFPSILLITTLYRLGINIASTRQILLHAYAGDIIEAFGEFVVGGNYVVGGVIFLIITLVQFIVVTKGAERVAEVAARFRLDAMPGKQMSIDADMRAGILDANQARDKRLLLTRESELYGSMDGAMKFVKGDAIAGIVITLINIVGGLIIGMAQHGMSAGTAAKVYSLLSIGDGLVSQVPAILIAVCAGIVTTRVSSSEKDSNLGSEISKQILSQPKALILAALVLLGIGSIKAFPFIPFAILATIIGGMGVSLFRADKLKLSKAGAGAASQDTSVPGHEMLPGESTGQYALTLPIILELGSHISKIIMTDKKNKQTTHIETMIPQMRQALYQDLGVRFPGVHVRYNSPNIKENEYSILLNEVPIQKGQIIKDYVLTNESEETLKRYNLAHMSYTNSLNMPSYWVENKKRDILDKASIKYWTTIEVIVLHLSHFFKHYASEFLGIQEVRSMLEFLEKSYPDLIREVTRLIPLQKLTEIFKRLVQEQVSIKDLKTIMESLSEWAQSEKDTVMLTEYIRTSLKRYISYKYSQGQSVLSVYMLDPEIEDIVRGGIKQTSSGSYISLDPDSNQIILQALRKTIVPPQPGAQPPVLLTGIEVRRFVRKLVESDFPYLSVLSFNEIVPEIKVLPLGRIQIT